MFRYPPHPRSFTPVWELFQAGTHQERPCELKSKLSRAIQYLGEWKLGILSRHMLISRNSCYWRNLATGQATCTSPLAAGPFLLHLWQAASWRWAWSLLPPVLQLPPNPFAYPAQLLGSVFTALRQVQMPLDTVHSPGILHLALHIP